MSATPVVFDVATAEQGVSEMLRGAALSLHALGRPLELHLVVYDIEEAQQLAELELAAAARQHGVVVEFHRAHDRLPANVESPVRVYRTYPGNPINTAVRLAKELQGVVISPGNTGLVMTCALFEFGRVPGVERPPIATPWPTLRETMFALDSGANVDLRPHHLLEFAHIGKVYVERIFGRKNPRVGLLSNGSEEYKGNALVKEAHRLLTKDSAINYVGYIEGQNFFAGEADLLLMDGFVGNILLKFGEGLAATVYRVLREEIRANLLAAISAKLFMTSSLRRFKKRFDYAEWGGAPLLGVKGNVVISHGRSDAAAVKNAIRWAVRMAEERIAERIEQELLESGLAATEDSGRSA